jgi:HPt (histidine-containing phosphotransfer) domain-containing protein
MYLDQTSQQLTELVDLMNKNDLEPSRQVAHRIASSSLSFGLNRLGNRLREIEQAAKEGTRFSPNESAELQTIYAESRTALERACRQHD